MVPVTSLWLPILVSAIAVFIVSSIIHMVVGYHRADWKRLPSEDEMQAALRRFNIPPGDYMMPCPASPAEMQTPEFKARVVSIFAGYVAGVALAPGTPYIKVFRLAGTVAFAGYALALLQHSIWYHRRWATTFRSMFDGLVYALFTAGTFGWLWPA